MVLNTHGNVFQKGFPDKYCIHPTYKQRWVELKISTRYKFTPAQLETFPIFDQCGIGIWVLSASDESEYAKLFEKPNWKTFLKKKDKEIIRNKYPQLASSYE